MTTTNESIPALYEVWHIAFEYEDQPGVTKERPVTIGANDEEFALVLVMKVTSHAPRPNYPGEAPLEDWKDAGLDNLPLRAARKRFSSSDLISLAAIDMGSCLPGIHLRSQHH